MPMPTPRKGEEEREFKDRCMGDTVMNRDFPESPQRYAICQRQWDERDNKAMRYAHVAAAFFNAPWAIEESKLHAIKDLILLRVSGGHVAPEEIAAIVGAARQPASRPSGDAVAVIPVYGVITPRANMMTEMSGGTSAEMIGKALDAAIADPQVGSILMEYDSPGGNAMGMTELAAKIRSGNTVKPITAHVNQWAASAAYWLASQAGDVVATPSAMLGSIGVYLEHMDISRALDAEGITVTMISAGKFKTEGNPYQPLGDEARSATKALVDGVYAAFVSDVAKGRGVSTAAVRGGYGEGRVVNAADAKALGMIDRVATFDDTLARLMGRRPAAAGAKAETYLNIDRGWSVPDLEDGVTVVGETVTLSCDLDPLPDALAIREHDLDLARRRLDLLGA